MNEACMLRLWTAWLQNFYSDLLETLFEAKSCVVRALSFINTVLS